MSVYLFYEFSETVKEHNKFQGTCGLFLYHTYPLQLGSSPVRHIFPSFLFSFPKARSLSSINKAFHLLFYSLPFSSVFVCLSVSVWPCFCFAGASKGATNHCGSAMRRSTVSSIFDYDARHIWTSETRTFSSGELSVWWMLGVENVSVIFVFVMGYMQMSCRSNERQMWKIVAFLMTYNKNKRTTEWSCPEIGCF